MRGVGGARRDGNGPVHVLLRSPDAPSFDFPANIGRGWSPRRTTTCPGTTTTRPASVGRWRSDMPPSVPRRQPSLLASQGTTYCNNFLSAVNLRQLRMTTKFIRPPPLGSAAAAAASQRLHGAIALGGVAVSECGIGQTVRFCSRRGGQSAAADPMARPRRSVPNAAAVGTSGRVFAIRVGDLATRGDHVTASGAAVRQTRTRSGRDGAGSGDPT